MTKICPACFLPSDSGLTTCPKDGVRLEAFEGWQPGELVDEKYRVVREIGLGSLGAVYEAEHLHLGETRALKLLFRRIADQDDLVVSLERQVRSMRALSHPNIVRVHDVHTSGG